MFVYELRTHAHTHNFPKNFSNSHLNVLNKGWVMYSQWRYFVCLRGREDLESKITLLFLFFFILFIHYTIYHNSQYFLIFPLSVSFLHCVKTNSTHLSRSVSTITSFLDFFQSLILWGRLKTPISRGPFLVHTSGTPASLYTGLVFEVLSIRTGNKYRYRGTSSHRRVS